MVTTAKIVIKEKINDIEVSHTINLPSIYFGNSTLGMVVDKSKENTIGIFCKTITEEESKQYKPEEKLVDFQPEALLNFKNSKALKEIGEYFIKIANDIDKKNV